MIARTALARPLLGVSLALGVALPSGAQQDAEPAGAGGSAASSPADGAAARSLPEGVVATVNERPVAELSLQNVVRQLSAEGETPDRERIVDELIDLEILAQEAEKMDLDTRPEIAATLQLQYTQTMANAYLAAIGEEIEFSEEELRAEYRRQTEGLDREEFRASHILLESEEEARAVIDELADGADFAELARTRSTDPAGQNSGGDLGWFQAGSMAPEITAALQGLEVGESTAEPVRTDFGYHVVLLADRRGAALPDYESVKPGLANLALRNRLAERVEQLRRSAEVVRR